MLTKQAFRRKYPQLDENRARTAYYLLQVCGVSEVAKTSYNANMDDLEALEQQIIDKIDKDGNYLPK